MQPPRPADHRSAHPTIVSRFRVMLDARMHSVSDYLNVRASRMSRKTLKRLAVLVIVCWGTACIAIILDSLLSRQMAYRPGRLSYPESILSRPSGASLPRDSGLLRAGSHIARFRDYLDSLREHDPDHYRHILHTRPGLLDSLQQIEDILSHLNQ